MEEGTLETKSDIKKVTSSDGIERDCIDTYEKLYWIVNERFKEQKEKNPDAEPIIDLSNVVICLGKGYSDFWIGKLCGNIEGIKNLGDEKDLIPNNLGGITIKNEIQFEVKSKITFANSILYSMQFCNTRFLKYVNLSNVRFKSSTNVSDSIFFNDVNLTQIDISQDIDSSDKLPRIIGDIRFQNIIFKKVVSFDCEKWNKWNNFYFNENTFEGDVSFMFCTITDPNGYFYDFTNSNFKGDVLIDSRGNSGSSTPISQINFDRSHFHKKLKIFGVQIGNILMRNCHFDSTANISQNYYDTLSCLDFSFSTINSLFFIDSDLGNDMGEPINLEKEISFSKSLITKDAFLFLRNINKGNDAKKQGCLNFKYANILGTITIQDSKLKEIKLAKSTLIGNINIEDVDTGYDCRESIAKIKDSFLKRNDVVNSLVYKAKEMESYSNDLSKCFSCKFLKINKIKFIDLIKKYFMTLKLFRFIVKNLWSFIKFVLLKCILLPLVILPIGILLSIIPSKSLEKVREYTLLYLNRISNSFGMSWGRGVLFTCVTALLFFILINYQGMPAPFSENIPNGETCFGYLWENYLNMFYLLDFKEKFSKGIILNPFGETLFFVSKIFVSYGIYQTISAFRKYGK